MALNDKIKLLSAEIEASGVSSETIIHLRLALDEAADISDFEEKQGLVQFLIASKIPPLLTEYVLSASPASSSAEADSIVIFESVWILCLLAELAASHQQTLSLFLSPCEEFLSQTIYPFFTRVFEPKDEIISTISNALKNQILVCAQNMRKSSLLYPVTISNFPYDLYAKTVHWVLELNKDSFQALSSVDCSYLKNCVLAIGYGMVQSYETIHHSDDDDWDGWGAEEGEKVDWNLVRQILFSFEDDDITDSTLQGLNGYHSSKDEWSVSLLQQVLSIAASSLSSARFRCASCLLAIANLLAYLYDVLPADEWKATERIKAVKSFCESDEFLDFMTSLLLQAKDANDPFLVSELDFIISFFNCKLSDSPESFVLGYYPLCLQRIQSNNFDDSFATKFSYLAYQCCAHYNTVPCDFSPSIASKYLAHFETVEDASELQVSVIQLIRITSFISLPDFSSGQSMTIPPELQPEYAKLFLKALYSEDHEISCVAALGLGDMSRGLSREVFDTCFTSPDHSILSFLTSVIDQSKEKATGTLHQRTTFTIDSCLHTFHLSDSRHISPTLFVSSALPILNYLMQNQCSDIAVACMLNYVQLDSTYLEIILNSGGIDVSAWVTLPQPQVDKRDVSCPTHLLQLINIIASSSTERKEQVASANTVECFEQFLGNEWHHETVTRLLFRLYRKEPHQLRRGEPPAVADGDCTYGEEFI